MTEEVIERMEKAQNHIPKIRVVNAMCGMGKTSAAINMMKQPFSGKFMYVTPFLTEVNRVIKGCPDKRFVQPREAFGNGSKLLNMRDLVGAEKNIASTHALFSMFTPELIDITKFNDYILVMDEVADVVREYEISKDDLEDILTNYASVGEDGKIVWDKKQDYRGEFDEHKRLIDLGAIYLVGGKALIWTFPVECFKAFKEIYILTYMFDSQIQKYYYDSFGLEYENWYVKGDNVDNYEFTREVVEYDYSKYAKTLWIIGREKMNVIGNFKTSLSKTWFDMDAKHAEDTGIPGVSARILQKNLSNFFLNIVETPTSKNLWTTFKTYKKALSGKGYSKGFLSCNARASNAYRDRISLAYACNRYFTPEIKNFFLSKEIEVDEDGYALSELIQWVFRSAIRDGEEIVLYIPSSRMREMLVGWATEHGVFAGWYEDKQE